MVLEYLLAIFAVILGEILSKILEVLSKILPSFQKIRVRVYLRNPNSVRKTPHSPYG